MTFYIPVQAIGSSRPLSALPYGMARARFFRSLSTAGACRREAARLTASGAYAKGQRLDWSDAMQACRTCRADMADTCCHQPLTPLRPATHPAAVL